MKINNESMSKTRKIYFLRLIGRVIAFVIAVLCYISRKDVFAISEGMKFFSEFSILHLLWVVWICDMVTQLIPVKSHISIGSQKVFESLFKPIKEKAGTATGPIIDRPWAHTVRPYILLRYPVILREQPDEGYPSFNNLAYSNSKIGGTLC